jgi:hypothetical protein
MRSPATLALFALLLTASGLQAQRMAPKPGPMPRPAPAQGTPGRVSGVQPRSAFGHSPRPMGMPAPLMNRAYYPAALPRCFHSPDSAFWGTRDINREIQIMARRGFIPVTPGNEDPEISGSCYFPAGWRAYAFIVPAKEKLHVRLYHPNAGWFRLMMVDRWGQLRPGMLQNLIPTGNAEVSFANPTAETTAVYVIVDDPGWMSTEQNPFTLKVERTWDPAKTPVPALPPVLGIWAQDKAAGEQPAGKGAAPPAVPEAKGTPTA